MSALRHARKLRAPLSRKRKTGAPPVFRLRLGGLLPHAVPVGLLLALCALLFFVGLNASEMYRNEGLRALVARELLRGGHWAVPTLHGEPLFTKPPGMSVAIALVSWPQGSVSVASARLPSALAATFAVLLFYATFARALGRRAGAHRRGPAALLGPLARPRPVGRDRHAPTCLGDGRPALLPARRRGR